MPGYHGGVRARRLEGGKQPPLEIVAKPAMLCHALLCPNRDGKGSALLIETFTSL